MFPKGRFLVPGKGLEVMPGNQNDKCPRRAWRLGKLVRGLSDEHTGEHRGCGLGESGDTVNRRAGRECLRFARCESGFGGWVDYFWCRQLTDRKHLVLEDTTHILVCKEHASSSPQCGFVRATGSEIPFDLYRLLPLRSLPPSLTEHKYLENGSTWFSF